MKNPLVEILEYFTKDTETPPPMSAASWAIFLVAAGGVCVVLAWLLVGR